VVRIEPKAFLALVASAPDVFERLTALARERMGGLQAFAAKPAKARAIIVGHKLDTACRDLRTILARNEIRFDWLLPDAPDLATKWPRASPSSSDLPAIACEDGTTHIKARLRDLAERLGLQTSPKRADYDTVIIGASRDVVAERELPRLPDGRVGR
jgi:thioredoxin reductase (NADPH)